MGASVRHTAGVFERRPLRNYRSPIDRRDEPASWQHAILPTDDEIGIEDAETLEREEKGRQQRLAALARRYTTRFIQAGTVAELQQIGGELTSTVKRQLAAADLTRIRTSYADHLVSLKAPATINGAAHGAGRNGS